MAANMYRKRVPFPLQRTDGFDRRSSYASSSTSTSSQSSLPLRGRYDSLLSNHTVSSSSSIADDSSYCVAGYASPDTTPSTTPLSTPTKQSFSPKVQEIRLPEQRDHLSSNKPLPPITPPPTPKDSSHSLRPPRPAPERPSFKHKPSPLVPRTTGVKTGVTLRQKREMLARMLSAECAMDIPPQTLLTIRSILTPYIPVLEKRNQAACVEIDDLPTEAIDNLYCCLFGRPI